MKKVLIILLFLNLVGCSSSSSKSLKYAILNRLDTQSITISTFKKMNYFFSNKKEEVSDFFEDVKSDKFYLDYGLEHITNVDGMDELKIKDKKNTSAILYVHGGSFVHSLGSLHKNMFQYFLTLNHKFDIYFAKYRHQPKYHYPLGNIDVDNCITKLLKKYKKVFVMGDSAGGNILISVLLKRVVENRPLVNGIVLYSPFLDLSDSVKSRRYNKKVDIVIGNEYGYKYPKRLTRNPYFKEGENLKDMYISPIFADKKLFENFPPTYIVAGTDEALFDDSKILYSHIPQAIFERVSGLFHVFQLNISMKAARDNLRRTSNFLNMINDRMEINEK